MKKNLSEYLNKTEQEILSYIKNNLDLNKINPPHLGEAVNTYIERKAKRLRPAILLLACGCTGGAKKEIEAIPAAAAVELFHTWTLVHDDIIDEDELRRNQPTVHKLIEKRATEEELFNKTQVKQYGVNVAILAGDVQHGLAIKAFSDCALKMNVDPILILNLINYLENITLRKVMYGETIDVQFGYRVQKSFGSIKEEDIIDMINAKTGVLFEFCGLAGAMIGKNTVNFDDPEVKAIAGFSKNCGIAFQLQDDILGITGDQNSLGKPIGSDIREGKKTTILLESLKNATIEQREKIFSILGNKKCGENDMKEINRLFNDLNGIKHTQELAIKYINKAISYIEILQNSPYKTLLYELADFMINRNF